MTDLEQIFELQEELQRILGAHPEDIVDPEEKTQWIAIMALAAEDELHEMLGEIGWKPWATSRHINVDAVKSELVDTFQFFMNLCFAIGLTPAELMELHAKKVEKNVDRHYGGYDGVSTKCPICKRAIDDDAVSCELSVEGTSMGYCAQKAADTGEGLYSKENLQ